MGQTGNDMGLQLLFALMVNWLKVRTKMSVDGLCVRRFTQMFHGGIFGQISKV